MPRNIYLKRTAGRLLAPVNPSDKQEVEQLDIDEIVKCSISKPRNIRHHRKFWALCRVIGDQIDQPERIVKQLISIRVGHCDVVRTKQGEVMLPKSINFGSMDQVAFNDFYKRAINVVCRDILPGIDSRELEQHVQEFM